jgi:hypothetical protein
MTVFVTRLPYLAVCGSILGICFTAIKFLFNRISIIYAERLDFAKIGILAKDVASASAHDISFVDEQLYEARTYLKIQMLKSYLSGNIGAFVYHPRKFEVENKASGSEEQTDSGALDAESAISGADRTARTEQEEN